MGSIWRLVVKIRLRSIYVFTPLRIMLLRRITQTNLGTTPASYTGQVSWSPDGQYLAVGGNMRNLTIYQFNGQRDIESSFSRRLQQKF